MENNIVKKNNDTKTIGDKKTLGTRNIPLFWNSKRYYSENVFHAIATACILLFTLSFIILLILIFSGVFPNTAADVSATLPIGEQVILYITFFSLLIFIILKLNERRVRKQRLADFANSFSREIEVK